MYLIEKRIFDFDQNFYLTFEVDKKIEEGPLRKKNCPLRIKNGPLKDYFRKHSAQF